MYKKRPVLYLINAVSGINTGMGGHYYSLITILEAAQYPFSVVVVGDFLPPALTALAPRVVAPAEMLGLICDGAFDGFPLAGGLIHAFDPAAGAHAAPIARRLGIPLVVTKPGGPPARAHSPRPRNLIVFHPADEAVYRNTRLIYPRLLALIPNRVRPPADPAPARPDPFSDVPAGVLRLIRIARLSRDKRASIEQAINLADRLRTLGTETALAIVGVPQDPDVHAAIAARTGSDIRLFTDPAYTYQASELLPYADVVLGTGRGLMEAFAYGKPAFVPVKGRSLPCLVTPETYPHAFAENFSDRLALDSAAAAGSGPETFLQIWHDRARRAAHVAFMHERFEADMSVETGLKKLMAVYAAARPDSLFDRVAMRIERQIRQRLMKTR